MWAVSLVWPAGLRGAWGPCCGADVVVWVGWCGPAGWLCVFRVGGVARVAGWLAWRVGSVASAEPYTMRSAPIAFVFLSFCSDPPKSVTTYRESGRESDRESRVKSRESGVGSQPTLTYPPVGRLFFTNIPPKGYTAHKGTLYITIRSEKNHKCQSERTNPHPLTLAVDA